MLTMLFLAQMTTSVTPARGETEALDGWLSKSFGISGSTQETVFPPFSFGFGDGRSTQLLQSWRMTRTDLPSEGPERRSLVTWQDPVSGLECRCEISRYLDFPAVEWVLHFKNSGSAHTAILQDILSLDCGMPLPRPKGARLHYAKGSECRLDDFAPLSISLGPNEDDPQGAWIGESSPFSIQSKGGRSSCGALPFFNLDMGDHGVIGAIGWTGDWAASFYRTDTEARMRAGMRRTHLKLLPGEEIRLPRILLLFWEGDRMRGHNLLRQFILTHHTPHINGRPAEAPICYATWGGNFVDKHVAHGQWWKEQGLPLDYLWVDAGWFGEDEAKEGATVFNSSWWKYVGDWRPNPGYFPNGLKPLGEALRKMGLGFLLWVEPERVFKDTPWTREHPEWLLGPVGDNYLFNLGIPEARHMLTDFLSKLIDEGDLGCYRQDFNMDPRPFWEAADAPDRVGISEIRHITGLYAMWDDLRARRSGLLIDNCSSGGRRIDLETVSRSIPLWRSDVQCYPRFGVTAMQGQTHGLGLWIPLSTGCCDREDIYGFRSALGPGMILIMGEFEQNADMHFSIPWLRERLAELMSVREYFLGDFYPLLSYSLADDVWAAWQFDRPDLGEGMVLALRRPASPFAAMIPRLQHLDPDAEYDVRDADTSHTQRFVGRVLCESGLQIEIRDQPGSRLLVYKRIP